jgi:AcrR family transcriptional regulator
MNDHHTGIDRELLQRIVQLADEREVPVGLLPIEEIAAALGISRMTLYRRIGTRQSLNEAVRALGIEPGQEPDAHERAVQAAADLIRRDGIAALTVESVAMKARCALPTIYAQFGSRNGLLAAVFERHVPILAVRDALMDVPAGEEAAFQATVARAYHVILDAIAGDRELFRALLAEALRDPSGEIDEFLVDRYVPAVASHIVPWIERHIASGVIRRVPVVLVLHQFIAPVLLHTATRPILDAAGIFALPPLEETCDLLAEMFARAVIAER